MSIRYFFLIWSFFRNKSKSSKKVSSLKEEVQEVETRIAELQDILEQLEQEAKKSLSISGEIEGQ